jgi:hypothetical protein
MSSYEGGHMTAVNTVLYKHGRHSRFSLRIGRNLTTKTSTHDDATLRGSPAVWSSGCEASQSASYISSNGRMMPEDGAEVQLTIRSPSYKTCTHPRPPNAPDQAAQGRPPRALMKSRHAASVCPCLRHIYGAKKGGEKVRTAPVCATPHASNQPMAASGQPKAAGGKHPAQGSRRPRRSAVLTVPPMHRAATTISRCGQLLGGEGRGEGGGLSTRADVAAAAHATSSHSICSTTQTRPDRAGRVSGAQRHQRRPGRRPPSPDRVGNEGECSASGGLLLRPLPRAPRAVQPLHPAAPRKPGRAGW